MVSSGQCEAWSEEVSGLVDGWQWSGDIWMVSSGLTHGQKRSLD